MPALPLPFRPDGLANPHLPVIIHPSSLSPSKTTTDDNINIIARQQDSSPTPSETFVVVPDSYSALDSSPSPGVVVAITLGSVAGFLLLIMIIYSILGFGPMAIWTSRTEETDTRSHVSRSILSFRTRSERKPPRKTKARPVRATEMFEVRTRERVVERPVRGAGKRADRRSRSPIVVEPPRRREPSPLTETETSVPTGLPSDYDEENEVVVIEENTPPRRKSSRKQSSRPGDRQRRSSSYRGSSYGDSDDRRRTRR